MAKKSGKSKKPTIPRLVKSQPSIKPPEEATAPKPPPVIIKAPELPKSDPVRITTPASSPCPGVQPQATNLPPKKIEPISTFELFAYLITAFIVGGVFFLMFFA